MLLSSGILSNIQHLRSRVMTLYSNVESQESHARALTAVSVQVLCVGASDCFLHANMTISVISAHRLDYLVLCRQAVLRV